MHSYLKIKSKSLAAEARIIRTEEQRVLRRHQKWRAKAAERKGTLPPQVYFGLRDHRIWEVRKESRATHLAYGFLRGTDYKVMEASCHTRPDWARVEQLVKKYGTDDVRDRMQRFSEWKDAA